MPTLPWRSKLAAIPHQEYLVMASRLPLRSHRTNPRFLGLTMSVARQLEGTGGLVGYSLLAQPMRKTFWTLSAWTDRDALDAFVRTMPHLAVMENCAPTWGPPGSPPGWRRVLPFPSPGTTPSSASWRPPPPKARPPPSPRPRDPPICPATTTQHR
jgi:hypothetical protein